VGDVTISEGLLREFIDGLKQSAVAQQRAADTSEAIAKAVEISTTASERRQVAIMDSMVELHAARQRAVDEIKVHVEAKQKERDGWWKIALGIFGTAMVLATLLGVPIGRVISAIFKIKP